MRHLKPNPAQGALFSSDLKPVDHRPTTGIILSDTEKHFGIRLQQISLNNEYGGTVELPEKISKAREIFQSLEVQSKILVGIVKRDPASDKEYSIRADEFTDNERKGVLSALDAINDRLNTPYAGVLALTFLVQGKTEIRDAQTGLSAKRLVYSHSYLGDILETLAPKNELVKSLLSDGGQKITPIRTWIDLATRLQNGASQSGTRRWSGDRASAKKYCMQYLPFALVPSTETEQFQLSPLASSALKIAIKTSDTKDGSQCAVIVYDSDYLRSDLIAICKASCDDKKIIVGTTPREAKNIAKLSYIDVEKMDQPIRIVLLSKASLPEGLSNLERMGFPTDSPIIFANSRSRNHDILDLSQNPDRVFVHLSIA